MFRRGRVLAVIFSAVFSAGASPGGEPAGNAAAGLTADEMVVRADSAFNARNFAEAASLYQAFIDNFGKSKEPQVQDFIRRRRPTLAMSLVRAKDFSKARPAIEATLALDPPPEKKDEQELTFWLGVCQFQDKDYAEASATLGRFLALFPPDAEMNPALRKAYPALALLPEARLLIGNALLQDEKYAQAAAHFAAVRAVMEPFGRGRATVLQLYALLQAGEDDAALELVKAEFPRMGEIVQLVSFQTLALELGDRLLEKGRFRDAIACLQRVWPQDRLLRHQDARLEDLKSRLAAAEADPLGDPHLKLELAQMVAKLDRESSQFRKITNFDAALRMRLASAYLRMGRHRESALILESMLGELPPGPIVEQASVNLVQSWFELERWPRAVAAARSFADTFPESASLPLVIYLRGLAEQNDGRHDDAIATFAALAKDQPKSEYAPRAMFMEGFTNLLAERNPAAIAAFDRFLKTHRKHELADAAQYWRAMGLSLDKQFAEARAAMEDYLDQRKDGAFRSAAFFRKAYCAQQLEDYRTSIRELTEYLKKFPGGDEAPEARVLLGDALMNEGRMEEGIEVFAGIPKSSPRFYEEGVFKTAKALRLMEEPDRLLAHLRDFIKDSPKSPRVAEAVYEIGRVHRERGEPEKARDQYRAAILEHGNDPAIRSVDDLFPALAKLHREPAEKAAHLEKLRDLHSSALRKKQTVLAMRALWAKGRALAKTDPEAARRLTLEAAALSDPSTTNPLLLADFAEAFDAAGKPDDAARTWRDLVKWNPRAPQKDLALAAMGFLELSRGNDSAALAHFDRFARETLGSHRFGDVMLARARLQESRGDRAGARASLTALLENQTTPGAQKAEALFRIGELHMREKRPDLAIPYFQRIYVMHGKWREWVARAYLESGRAFEQLDDNFSARRTYDELARRDELATLPEAAEARARLDKLGGPPPPPSPTPAG